MGSTSSSSMGTAAKLRRTKSVSNSVSESNTLVVVAVVLLVAPQAGRAVFTAIIKV